ELYDLRSDAREQTNVSLDRTAEHRDLAGALERLSPRPVAGDTTPLADPKDTYEIVEQYREAGKLAADRKWSDAIRLLQTIVRDDDGIADVWASVAQYAMR